MVSTSPNHCRFAVSQYELTATRPTNPLYRCQHRASSYEDAANEAKTEHLELALAHLDRSGRRLIAEIEAVKAGQTVQEPICMNPYLAVDEQNSEHAVEYVIIRMALMQAECNRAIAV